MGTPPLAKNGHDQAQDRELRELREHFRQVRVQNDKDHSLIKEVLSDLRLAVATTNERIRGTRTVVVVVWTLFIVALGGIGWVVNQAALVIKEVDKKVDTVDARQQSNTAKGWQWADKLEAQDKSLKDTHREDMEHLHKDIKELRRDNGRQKD
jgi:hypothetical protein